MLLVRFGAGGLDNQVVGVTRLGEVTGVLVPQVCSTSQLDGEQQRLLLLLRLRSLLESGISPR
jgi:hypothetical protein